MVHWRCSRPPAGATVGLFDWCSALEENGLAVNTLRYLCQTAGIQEVMPLLPKSDGG